MSVQPKLLTERFEDFSSRYDWRWQRALALFSDGEIPQSGFDDKQTVLCYRFIKAFQETENVSQRQLLRMKHPHEMRAYDYYLNADNRRFKLEAMCLCADLTERDIAGLLDEPVEVIVLFEKFFFDIRGRNRNAVYNRLFPPNCFKDSLGGNLCDKIWKFFAISAGFKMLNCLINPYTITEESVNEALHIAKGQRGFDYSVASLIQPVARRDDLKDIHESFHRMREVDAKELEAAGSKLPDAQAMILQKCIEATHIQVMDPDYLLSSPHEPTVEELLAQAEALPVPVVVSQGD